MGMFQKVPEAAKTAQNLNRSVSPGNSKRISRPQSLEGYDRFFNPSSSCFVELGMLQTITL
jgi:hypothetical protein